MKQIYYCGKCAQCWGGDGTELKCPQCGTKLLRTIFSQETWRSFSQEEKNKYHKIFHDSYLKKTGQAPTKNQQASDAASFKSSKDFYTECMTEFHLLAQKKGVASKGLIYIPELMPIGQKITLAYLKDNFFQSQFSSSPDMYYYFIFSLCIDAGICCATMWHENFSNLNRYVAELIKNGSADDANEIMKKNLPAISANQGNDFMRYLYAKWKELHEPYWKLNDPRDYTFAAMVAGYQLGISMILEKFGY